MNRALPLRLLRAIVPRFQSSGRECIRGLSQVVPALVGVPISLAVLILLGYAVLAKSVTSPAIKVLLSLMAVILVAQWVLDQWDRLPADDQGQFLKRWQGLSERLLSSRALGLWPVLVVVLTALVGFTDWFPASGAGRLMMLGSIATVAIYGYFREEDEKRKDLLAFADKARDRFAEAAKQIHEKRDREIEERERSAQIDGLIKDLEDLCSQYKEQSRYLHVPIGELVDTSELRKQLENSGFIPTDDEYQYILSRLGLEV
jgi:hypothetical protein